ncbi:hypothetical protein AVEN_130477-1 [Araneus ventricosus]|uniref:RNase H type-1 domain-containing protein n=1 Tax=Araneus ventricosus TaxID=182803 RepID=A0A4Y2I097_ARAVE|nr:hypothetical protein AVEN_130477-1 [Araneus ventricosus]
MAITGHDLTPPEGSLEPNYLAIEREPAFTNVISFGVSTHCFGRSWEPLYEVPPRRLPHPAHKSIRISLEETWRSDKTEFQIFTDGSKTDKGTPSTFCVFCHGFIHHKWWAKLYDNNSVIQAEMGALREVLRWLSQKSLAKCTIH